MMNEPDGNTGSAFVNLVGMPVLALLLMFLHLSPATVASNGGSDSCGSARGSRTWYFAEGTTRAGFSEWLCMLNPGGEPTTARVSYMLATGREIEKAYGLPAGSRTTVNVGADVPPGNDVSLSIESEKEIVAERPMYFDYQGAMPEGVLSDGHTVLGATAPGSKWYFAEGCTREGFDTYLSLGNPNRSETTVNVDYYCADGKREQRGGIRIGPRSRLTIPVHEPGLGIGRHNDGHGDFSIEVTAPDSAPVVAERPMYFRYRPYVRGGHNVVGVPAPRETWYFAEGCTREGFDTFLCIANPEDRAAVVDVRYAGADGVHEVKTGIRIGPKSRFTIPVHETDLGVGRHDGPRGDMSIEVGSSNGVPVVVERPMYFTYRPFWDGGHSAVGVVRPEKRWYFAEGCTRNGFDTYICVYNPGRREAVLNMTYYRGDGRSEARGGVAVPAGSRLTMPVHEAPFGIGRNDGAHGDVSIALESANGVPVVAERPVYFADRWRTIDRQALASARGWGEVFIGNTTSNRVALTFDVEGSGGYASTLLDIMKQKGVRCTLFVTGGLAASRPDLMVRMADEGHEIGNHSMTHPWFSRISDARIRSELAGTDAQVERATGFSTKPYFRFPNGDRNASLIRRVNSLGYLSVYWTVDPQEWRAGATAQGVHSVVVSQARSGAIVLMHDKPRAIEALPRIVDDLRARGFSLVTLSEVLSP